MKSIFFSTVFALSITHALAGKWTQTTDSCTAIYEHCNAYTAPAYQYQCAILYDYAKRSQVWASPEALSKIKGGTFHQKFCLYP